MAGTAAILGMQCAAAHAEPLTIEFVREMGTLAGEMEICGVRPIQLADFIESIHQLALADALAGPKPAPQTALDQFIAFALEELAARIKQSAGTSGHTCADVQAQWNALKPPD
jgi:hypothetical protein